MPQGRVDHFRGTDIEYIEYLENKLSKLTTPQIDRCRVCAVQLTQSVHSPPISPPSNVRKRARTDDIFIPYVPPPSSAITQEPVAKKQLLRWQYDMDKMLNDIPSADDWSSKRDMVGLSSSIDILRAFDMIIDGTKTPAVPLVANPYLPTDSHSSSDVLLRLASDYARTTSLLAVEKSFTTQIVLFRLLVFVSLCCVLLHHGVKRSLIDETMRICVSDSTDRNLDALRRGAGWVNRMISSLAPKGLGHRASEIFVLCGQSMSKYALYANAGSKAFSYFQDRVSTSGHENSNVEEQAWLPFSIPLLIKFVVGETCSLSSICVALGYDENFNADQYSLFCDNYRKRHISPPTNANIDSLNMSNACYAATFDGSGDLANSEEPATADINSNQLEVLLTPAHHGDIFPQRLARHELPSNKMPNCTSLRESTEIHNTGTNSIPSHSGSSNTTSSSLAFESIFYSPEWETIGILDAGELSFHGGEYEGLQMTWE